MNTLDEVKSLILRLREPERRQLAAWLTESLPDGWQVAEPAARYGAAAENVDAKCRVRMRKIPPRSIGSSSRSCRARQSALTAGRKR